MKTVENLDWKVNNIETSESCIWLSYIQNHMILQPHHPITPKPRNFFILKIQLKKWS